MPKYPMGSERWVIHMDNAIWGVYLINMTQR